MQDLIGNPLYHWTASEFKRYFDIDAPLNEDTAKEIWDTVDEKLKCDDFTAKALIRRSNVDVICTTDNHYDTFEYHKQLKDFETKSAQFQSKKKRQELLKALVDQGYSQLTASSLKVTLSILDDIHAKVKMIEEQI